MPDFFIRFKEYTMKFSEMKYVRPDIDILKQELCSVKELIASASCAKEAETAYKRAEEKSLAYSSMSSLCYIRHTINTKDEFYEKENDFFDENGPIISDILNQINRALLDSPFRPQLEKELGELLFINTEISVRSFSSEIIELAAEENRLQSEYQKLYASATVEWNGEQIPLTMLGPHKQSADREIRRKAFLKDAEFFDSHREEFDSLYDKLIKNRNRQARMLGYENYIKLGYDRLGRNCYGPKEVAAFRDEIKNHIVPIVSSLKEEQKKRIGVDALHLYDNDIMFKEGNVKPHPDSDGILKAGIEMYREMSAETAEFIDYMSENELYDLISRDGKAPGGYCTEIMEYKAPFIFSNFNGTAGDVDVLTHEAGHAFAFFRAMRQDILPSYYSPTIEACEVHSMTMEFLASPWYERFFEEETPRYEYYHAADALCFIPYGCMVDEFQHIMYENEDLTPEERNKVWLSLEEKYRPHLDVSDLPFYSRGGGWQRQLHIYLYPLYYIDYCMAQTVAFCFFAEAISDRTAAFNKYLAFVDGAGTKTFEALVKGAGLTPPYEAGCLENTAKVIKSWLDEKIQNV